jgi:hypothetical protein
VDLSLRVTNEKGADMRKLLSNPRVVVGGTSVLAFALAAVPALATPTVPTLDVASYGDSLLSSLGTSIQAVFPYAAAVTAFAIGVGMVKRWLGHRKATAI